MKLRHLLSLVLFLLSWQQVVIAAPATGVVENLSFNGQVDPDQASFILKGRLKGGSPDEQEPKLIYSAQSQARFQVEPRAITQTVDLKTRIFQGKLKELLLAMRGEGEVTNVTGPELKDWSIRFLAPGKRYLVLRPIDQPTNTPPLTNFNVTIQSKQTYRKLPVTTALLTFTPENTTFFDGLIDLKPHDSLELSTTNFNGLLPVRSLTTPASEQPLQFRLAAQDYALTIDVREKDPEARQIAWDNFKLAGELKDQFASFVLTGQAVVKHPDGGTLAVLAGDAALTSFPTNTEMKYAQGRYWLRFRKPGTYPIELKFNAKVTPQDGWNGLNFEVVPSALCPLVLKGLSADTQFQFPGAAKPERQGADFASYLPSSGKLQLQWKEAKTEELGKLFYSVQGTAQIAVGPGLLRQAYAMEFKVMQGELSRLIFDLTGEGEVTRVRGDDILSWKTETNAEKKRQLIVQLSQARKDRYPLIIQTQTPLGAFPLQVQPLRLVPIQAIRYGGHLLVINDGAVRLEVAESRGLSQISPDLFPQSKELAELAPAQRSQAFAYRYSGGDFSLAIQAEHILPELTVSQVLMYNLGETETAIDAELELDIREAPLREFYLRVPADYTVSRLNTSDFSLLPDEAGWARLKMIFANPISGRQVLQLRLEKNQNAAAGPWTLPVLQPQNVKSLRGYVGVSAETGFRIAPGELTGLTEIANAYFPKKVPGLQAAYRLREDAWQARMNIERLALAIQADVTHLFTISEGIAYGSSVMNYFISGSPVSTLKVAVPPEYSNIEFAGRDLRNWKKTATGYEIYLHTPVFGTYTLLATFDRQFTAQSNTVSFVGARPIDAQSERGSVLVVSDYQFEVKPAAASPGLLQLDAGEISPEHRLLFDSPLLTGYQYSGRPHYLALTLHSLELGETVRQVVDRAALKTHISREGEVVTEANYYLKSQGHSHLRFSIATNAQLWEATVNGSKVVPVSDRNQTLIPLPTKLDPSALLNVQLKMASKSPDKLRVKFAAPAIAAPVMLTEWSVSPDDKYRLEYQGGTVAPAARDSNSGFAWVWRAMRYSEPSGQATLVAIPILLVLSMLLVRWGTREGVTRWSISNLLGAGLGLLACLAAIGCLITMISAAANLPIPTTPGIGLVAPIQNPDSVLSMQVKNIEIEKLGFSIWYAWPTLLGLALWIYLPTRVQAGALRHAGIILGWIFFCWAALRVPNGAPAFFILVLMFSILHLLIPSLRSQWLLRRRIKIPTETAAATTALLLLGLLTLGLPSQGRGQAVPGPESLDEPVKSIVQSVIQQARIQDKFIYVTARLQWKAEAGQRLEFLSAPAVLNKIDYPQSALELTARQPSTSNNPTSGYKLTAKESGVFDVAFQYQISLGGDTGFTLPTAYGMVNRLELEIEKAEVDIFADRAVSVQAVHEKRQGMDITRAEVVLAPVQKPLISWKPRSRDTKTEKAVFYAELWHLFIPTPGVVEGVHEVQVRPAQGQLPEVTFQVPPALTITDVQADFVSAWRFDPDQRVLRVQFNAPQSKPFALRLRSQLATTPLPYQQTLGVITLNLAAGQVGMLGLATGSEVQLDQVKESLSAINLEDFPAPLVTENVRQVPGLTLRRAFRYSDAASQLNFSASAVQPDVRVETQETFSIGEDRTVLASQLSVHVTRAGLFKLSFVLPRDFEVESLTGPALSHWAELKSGSDRIITMNLRGKTEGDQTFSITLAGPGIGNRKEWEAPRLVLREANKQVGQLLVVPESGMRLHVKTREGLTQLDPQKVGIRQKGVMAYRLLHNRWQFGFDIETVEPWVQVNSLQDVTIREGQVLVSVQFDYQIENAGLKALWLQLPATAENVRFEGDLISDNIRSESGTNRLAEWQIKLQRRVMGNYALRASYQLPLTNQSARLGISGVKAKDANLQRGYLALRAAGRLQIELPQIPAALQRTEWQSIPASLRRNRELAESKDSFSTLESDYELPLVLTRHELAKVLPARVERLELTSVVAPSGEMLTEGRLLIYPGDKRLLRLELPAAAQFWYSFMNGQSATPWQEGKRTLIMLEKNSDPAKPTMVEFFYTCQTGAEKTRGFSHQILGPSFDLPLENITWKVFVPESWELRDWESSLQFHPEVVAGTPDSMTLKSYLETEQERQAQNTKQAEMLFNMGNEFVQKGVPQQARRAYQAAWKLSPQDAAFNEDARVELHKIKMQQALLGLNQRRQEAFDAQEKREGKAPRSQFQNWVPGQAPGYTQQQAKEVLEQNPAEDNAALQRLADRLIRQQDAGLGRPQSIHATLPAQGKQLTFTGSLQVQSWADLRVKLNAKTAQPSQRVARFVALGGLFIFLAFLTVLARNPANIKKQAS